MASEIHSEVYWPLEQENQNQQIKVNWKENHRLQTLKENLPKDTNFHSINVTNTIKGKSLKSTKYYILTYKTPKFGKKT